MSSHFFVAVIARAARVCLRGDKFASVDLEQSSLLFAIFKDMNCDKNQIKLYHLVREPQDGHEKELNRIGLILQMNRRL